MPRYWGRTPRHEAMGDMGMAHRLLMLVWMAVAGAAGPSAYGDEADPLVARVNGHEIRLSHVYRQVESLSLGDQVDVQAELASVSYRTEVVARDTINVIMNEWTNETPKNYQ